MSQPFDERELDEVAEVLYTAPSGVKYRAVEVIEALTPLISEARCARINQVLSRRLSSLVLGVEDLYHEHNGAACIRTAEGLGIHHIYAAELKTPYPFDEERELAGQTPLTKAERRARQLPSGVSMHAHRWVDLETFRAEGELSAGVNLIRSAQQRGYRVFGAGPRGRFELADIPVDQPLVLLFGNEARGLRDETMEACDEVFKIPMYGFTESFNISVSVGMSLEQVGAKRRALLAERGVFGDLTAHDRASWSARWLARELKQIDQLLGQLLIPVEV